MIPASIQDYRNLARKRLPHFLFEYLDGGAFGETTLERNSRDFQHLALRQRVLRNVDDIRLSGELLGQPVALPLVLAPVGIAGLYARRGEVQAARAAQAAGVPFCLSTVSACSLEEVCRGSGAPVWFQLYMMRDKGFLKAMLERARELGTETLLLTVDMPVPATRYRDIRSGLAGGRPLRRRLARVSQALRRPGWCWDVGLWGRPHTLGNIAPLLRNRAGIDEFWGWLGSNFDPTVTWRDLERVRSLWPGKLIIKGILDGEDARQAADAGVDGIVVSNHGGRQLDGAPSSITALPGIARALDGSKRREELTLLLDSGVRSGLDIVRALALGADGVMIGRPWVYGLAASGQAGVSAVIQCLAAEMRVAMALTGCRSLEDPGPDIICPTPATG